MGTVATSHSDAFAVSGERRCQLVVVDGPDAGRGVRIGEGQLAVGTDPHADLRLTDTRVSQRHLSVRREGADFEIRDLNSTNGTFYEGSRIERATVPLGATLKIGHSYLRIQAEPAPLDVAPSSARRFGDLIGHSLALREVFAVLELAATSDVTVLLEGETGVGKELAARALHEQGTRRKGPFVALDCSALPAGLLESELFGHREGAFSGAVRDRTGAFLRAHQGTLFLDELDSVHSDVQARLLRAIEERTIRPVGSDGEVKVDVRIVAGSRSDLSARVAEGGFRSDLYYRLSVLRLRLPPLRDRREDIEPIALALLRHRGLPGSSLDPRSMPALRAHDWPGNVRELRNVVDRAVALHPKIRTAEALPLVLDGPGRGDPFAVRTDLPFGEAKREVIDAFERTYLRSLLDAHEGNISQAARTAKMDRKHLRELLKKHRLIHAAKEPSP
ncbi:MAG: sigma 54-interacting transcriptional regulator [Myxococcota bacterium]